ncbi:MAG: O-antigen ligase family protein [Anaerolineaceae bacterium]|nr:O-antigen ligase family protein [Anaerolineaceae bacterium]
MAPFALLLCAGFVLFLLWIEWRASRYISLTVWIPTFWIMVMSSRPLGLWFQFDNKSPGGGNEGGSPLDRWTFTALAILAVIVLVRRRFDWCGSLRRHKWLVAVLAYMFVSTFWSDIPSIALRRWVRETLVLVMAFCLMSEADPRQALAAVLRRTAYVLVPLSIVLIKYYPEFGRAYGRFSGIQMWTGVTCQKNELGRMCMISTLFLLFALYVRWRESQRGRRLRDQAWADGGIVLLAMYLLVESHSSTSLTTFILGVAFLFGLQGFRRLKLMVPRTGLVVLAIVLMVFGVVTPFLGGANIAGFTSTLGRDTTLTGRTEVWADVIPAWRKEPVLGYGLGSFWTDSRRQLYDIPTAHNGYLDILLELGEVGLAFYAIWILSCSRSLHRALHHDYDWASLGICLLFVGLVYNLTESALNSFTEEMTTVATLAVIVAGSHSESIKSKVQILAPATTLGNQVGLLLGQNSDQIAEEET